MLSNNGSALSPGQQLGINILGVRHIEASDEGVEPAEVIESSQLLATTSTD